MPVLGSPAEGSDHWRDTGEHPAMLGETSTSVSPVASSHSQVLPVNGPGSTGPAQLCMGDGAQPAPRHLAKIRQDSISLAISQEA